MWNHKRMRFLLIGVAMALTACAGTTLAENAVDTPTPNRETPVVEGTPLLGNLDQVTFIEDDTTYTIRQLIPRDGIAPVYNPQFTDAENAGYDADELVMGVEINGDVRAYSVGTLRHREMVNDVVGDVPVLVTW